jgi:hypothetical protein
MAHAAVLTHSIHDDSDELNIPLVEMASAELESLRDASDLKSQRYCQFPPACLAMLNDIDGNHRCIDCGAHDPQWATVSYGALLCLHCSGHHRSLGVQVSRVRSISMDEWSLPEVLSMLEGGNGQLSTFFSRHALSEDACQSDGNKRKVITKENVTRLRYKTKAAEFYRQQMELHVCSVLQSGPYRGREISRRRNQPKVDRRNSDL